MAISPITTEIVSTHEMRYCLGPMIGSGKNTIRVLSIPSTIPAA